MFEKINLAQFSGKKWLVAPLDWGLGHATRCIPIIRALLKNNCPVWLAGEKHQEVLLRKEFPSLPFLPLDGYRVQYARSGTSLKILSQVPKILSAIRNENKWLKTQVDRYGFDVVLSDNRYGLYHPGVHSIFLTHQLSIQSPWGSWSEIFLQKWNYHYLNRFDECWIPDEAGTNNLAGALSHPEKLPAIPVSYIGWLSRFEKKPVTEKKGHLLILISGPEPGRTNFENMVVNQVAHYPGTATLVRGLPGAEDILPSSAAIRIYNHLSSDLLNEEMAHGEMVISRCGYSTVMDLAVMEKKSILVPTPEQTEQEYLGSHLMQKRFAFTVPQKKFSLLKNLDEARIFYNPSFNKS
jgi:hypothetical protein